MFLMTPVSAEAATVAGEPAILLGNNTGPNPAEHLLHGPGGEARLQQEHEEEIHGRRDGERDQEQGAPAPDAQRQHEGDERGEDAERGAEPQP